MTPTTFRVNGDKAVYTGRTQFLHGATCYEGRVIEGHRNGELVWTYRKPGATFTETQSIIRHGEK